MEKKLINTLTAVLHNTHTHIFVDIFRHTKKSQSILYYYFYTKFENSNYKFMRFWLFIANLRENKVKYLPRVSHFYYTQKRKTEYKNANLHF